MKIIRILTSPYLLIFSFLIILISGKHFGGFYALYLLMALPHLATHAIFALAGIILLVLGQIKYKQRKLYGGRAIMNIVGAICLFLSIFLFFKQDSERYNYGTFEQTVPLFTLAIFGVLSVCFILSNFLKTSTTHSDNHLSVGKT